MIALGAILAVTGATIGLGLYGVRLARTTSDLFVASRAITPWWNAAAISGEYLSAASFLGIAGLQMKLGSGALCLPLALPPPLALFRRRFVRRFGAYTISDFAEARLGSAARARARRLGRARHRRLLPRPPAQGGRSHARRGHRRAVLARRRRRRCGGRAQRRRRRHARHHLRAGVPVLDEDVRDRAPRLPAPDPPRRAARARRDVRARVAARTGLRARGGARRPPARDLPGRDDLRRRRRAGTGGARARSARSRAARSRCRPAPWCPWPTASTPSAARTGRGPSTARARTRRCSSTRSCWRRSWARWACRTSSSASTRTRTARRRGAPRSGCSACSRSSTRSRSCTGRSAGCSCPSSTSPEPPTPWCCDCPRRRGPASAASCSARSWRRARSPRSCPRRRA